MTSELISSIFKKEEYEDIKKSEYERCNKTLIDKWRLLFRIGFGNKTFKIWMTPNGFYSESLFGKERRSLTLIKSRNRNGFSDTNQI